MLNQMNINVKNELECTAHRLLSVGPNKRIKAFTSLLLLDEIRWVAHAEDLDERFKVVLD